MTKAHIASTKPGYEVPQPPAGGTKHLRSDDQPIELRQCHASWNPGTLPSRGAWGVENPPSIHSPVPNCRLHSPTLRYRVACSKLAYHFRFETIWACGNLSVVVKSWQLWRPLNIRLQAIRQLTQRLGSRTRRKTTGVTSNLAGGLTSLLVLLPSVLVSAAAAAGGASGPASQIKG